MFIDIDYSKKPKDVKLHLAKPNKQIISHIYEKYKLTLSLKLGNINELSFSIPYMIEDENLQLITNPHVDLIKEKMLIRMTMDGQKEWFIVDEIEEDGDDSDVFNVKAFSLGYELKHKRISSIDEESINANDIMTQLLTGTVWTIGTIDPIFNSVYRQFKAENSNVLDCILQVGETYGALIQWDTELRKVSLLRLDTYGQFRGLTVDYGKFLRSIKRTRTTDELVTRLYVYGKEDLSINSVNPTGQSYIEDFSYFMYPFQRDANRNVISSSYFMSDALCHAILDHQALVAQNAPQIQSLLNQKATKQTQLTTEQSTLNQKQLELNNILNLLDIAKATEDQALITQRTTDRNNKQAEITAQTTVVTNLQNDIANLDAQIQTLQNQIANDPNFTPALKDELNLYIIEKEWRDDRYINAQELYNDALNKFQELRQPKVVFQVNIENLFNVIEEQYYWDKLVLGDLIKVKYKQMNIEYTAKIIEIHYDFESDEVNLVIANTKDLLSETEKLVQLLYSSSSASSLVQNNKYKWDKITPIQDQVNSIVSSEWDANKNKVTAGVNNKIEVGSRGIIIRNPDLPNNIVIAQAGIIALSKDGGETWKTAIKPDGIVAEQLIGQIIAGQNLIITNSSGHFTFDNTGARIKASNFVIESGTGSNLINDWNNNISDLQTRMSAAELKITDSAIVSTVRSSQLYNSDLANARLSVNAIKKVRYIRDWLNGNSVDSGNRWVEIKAMSKSVNRASGATVTEKFGVNTNISRVTDDNITSTNYFDGTSGQLTYVQVDLGAVYEDIDYIQIWHYYADGRTYYKTKTEISTDGVNWTTLFDSDLSGTYKETVDGLIVPVNIGRITGSITNNIAQLESRMTNAEQKITDSAIINTVTSSIEYQTDLQAKANAQDLANYATTFDLAETQANINASVDAKISAIDLSVYATKSEVTQTAQDMTIKFSSGGGVNLLRNSVGFAGTDFWTITGTVSTIQNAELDLKGSKSGFVLTGGTISQQILVTSQWYTISAIVKKGTAGTGYLKVTDGTTTQIVNLLDGTAYDYQKIQVQIQPVGNQLTVELNGDVASGGVIFTSVMANVGQVALQWQLSVGEVYNSNIRMDLNGIRVSQISNGREIGYTKMTPDKFAGYYDVNGDGVVDETVGSADEVFRMDKDEFVQKKATVKAEITMGSIKAININSGGYNGWAFVSTG